MQIISKSGVIDVEIFKNNNYGKQYYQTVAYNNDGEELGYVNFELKSHKVWIWSIGTREKFQFKGVGQTLLEVMEYMAISNKCMSIEGKFYPSNSYAKQFYLKNGYEINDDDYDQFVSSYITKEREALIVSKMHTNLLTPFEIKDVSQRPTTHDKVVEK